MKKRIRTIETGEWLFIIILLLFFVTDTLNVIFQKGVLANLIPVTKYTGVSAYSKLLFLFGYFTYYLLVDARSVKKVFFVGFFFVLFALLIHGFDNWILIFTWGVKYLKLLLPILLFLLLVDIKIIGADMLFKSYVAILGIQLIVVFISAMFEIDMFQTYAGGSRFGYSGLLFAQNEATFYYVITSVFTFKYWENTRSNGVFILLLLVLTASVLLGTKAVFLFLGSFIIFLGWYYKLYTKLFFWGGVIAIVTLAILVLYHAGIIEYYLNQVEDKGWMYMITSKRNILIQERLPSLFEQWHWYNYLFGGVNPATSFVEMDIIDLFLFGGIVGSILYYWLLFKTIFHFSKNNYIGWFLVLQYFLIGGLAGHVFASGINAIYLALTSYYLQRSEDGGV